MPVLRKPATPTHQLGTTCFTSLATPLSGSTETAVWEVTIEPNTPATPHMLTRGEVFVVLSGKATVVIGGVTDCAKVGDAIVVPANTRFELSNVGEERLQLVCCMPVGGQAGLDDGSTFTPPWAE